MWEPSPPAQEVDITFSLQMLNCCYPGKDPGKIPASDPVSKLLLLFPQAFGALLATLHHPRIPGYGVTCLLMGKTEKLKLETQHLSESLSFEAE